MKLFNKVAIIGVGLIGGSLGLAIKKERLAAQVWGVSRHKKTIAIARKKGAIDKGATDLGIIKDADLVILALPVSKILNLSRDISGLLKPDCLVTDVGSTKQEIVQRLGKIFPYFVGGHPLAGSEKSGILNARVDIFTGSLCILTPTAQTDKRALNEVERLWKRLGVKVIFMSSQLHDKIISLVSHLPHISAFSLIKSMPRQYLKFAPASLKDATRIASSDSCLWSDIFLSNQKNILKAIGLFQKSLEEIKSVIKKQDREALVKILKQAKDKRSNL